MKIVLDANVILSAFKFGGKPYEVTKRYAELDTLFYTDDIIIEFKEVLGRPK